MKTNRKTYSVFQLCSATFMILALMWLTVSTPFFIASQQDVARQKMEKSASSPMAGNEEEPNNPFGNNTEEKAPNANTFSEEYLHHFDITSPFYTKISQYHKHENSDAYIAFHGELLVPPPNAS